MTNPIQHGFSVIHLSHAFLFKLGLKLYENQTVR
ncbi:hypothetical protein P872_10205 [Rhodonellum psychrophilum GCM71 = DSM 17998]|uniref:Uncharacterized protein n=1 Tax=Rhodonellum psychrophilum GCM71 = DSM 17998 TaxID=1123057 RepID=U5BUD5_9BACT|nr:hypothetical protein P872_10205 [Rhodonellum psychrophilum GCM71 = DSM 17998]